MTRLLSRLIRGILYLPKTIYINFKTLPFNQAVKMPILLMSGSHLHGLKKGSIVFECPVKTGIVHLGAQKTEKRGVQTSPKTSVIIDNGGRIIFKGKATFGKGTSICTNGGEIVFGKKFSCNVNCFIYANTSIVFHEDVLLGWNVNVRDNDGHPILNERNELTNPDKGVEVNDHVWIASYVDVMKGVTIAEGTVVGTRSLVTKSNEEKNSVIAGVPAKVIKRNINWQHGDGTD